jgi:pyrroline-5-carboxylate reductase
MSILKEKFAFIGAGSIAEAWIERLLRSKTVTPDQIFACDPNVERLAYLSSRWGINTSSANPDGARFADLVILAPPPPQAIPVLLEVRSVMRPGQIVISLAAAVPLAALQDAAGGVTVVRVMPNIPALVGEAMSLLAYPDSLSKPERLRLEQLVEVFGKWFVVPDKEINQWCALCAVGPTFVLPMLDALATAATAQGLSSEKVITGVAHMVAGTARMVQHSGRTPEQLKQMIGLRTLREDEARKLFTDAFSEAVAKLQALGEKLASAA